MKARKTIAVLLAAAMLCSAAMPAWAETVDKVATQETAVYAQENDAGVQQATCAITIVGEEENFASNTEKYYRVDAGKLIEADAENYNVKIEAFGNEYEVTDFHVTLQNAVFTKADDGKNYYMGLDVNRNLHLTLLGNNTLPGEILTRGDLDIDGGGQLNVPIDDNSKCRGIAISSLDGGIEITDGVKINVQVNTTQRMTGVDCYYKGIEVKEKAEISLTGNMLYGISTFGSFVLDGGTVKIRGAGTSLSDDGCIAGDGLHASKQVVINDGLLQITDVNGYGIAIGNTGEETDGKLIVNAGTVQLLNIQKATYKDYSHGGDGIWAYRDIEINGGTVTAQNVDEIALFANKDITLGGGEVSVSNSGNALLAEKNIVVNNGTVNIANVGEAGLTTNQGDVTINGGNVTIDNASTSTDIVGANPRDAIYAMLGDVNIADGVVTIQNAKQTGISVYTGYSDDYKGTIRITGGTVNVDADKNAIQAFSGGVQFGGNAVVEAHSNQWNTIGSGDITVTGNDCDITLRTDAKRTIGGWVKLVDADEMVFLGGDSEQEAVEIEKQEKDGTTQVQPPDCKYLHIVKGENPPAPNPPSPEPEPSPVVPAENGKIDVNGTWLEFAPEATKYYKIVDGILTESAAADATITVEATKNGYHVTLNSAEMTNPTAMQGYAALHTTRDLHLTLVGENVLPGPVVADGTLTVDGTGSAQVTVDNTSNLGCMLAGNAGAEIGGNVKITGQNTATFGVTGLYTRTGDAVIKDSADASLNGNMENGVLNMHASLRIQGGRLYINGARVQDNEYRSGGNGVYASGDVTVDGGTLEITNIDGKGIAAGSGKADGSVSGIDGGMTVNSGTVKISDIRGLTVGNSVMGQGISVYKDVVVNGGRVEISNVGGNGMDIGCMDNDGNSIGDFILNGGMVYLSDIRRIDYGKYGYGGKGITTAVDIKINDGTVATLNVGVNDLFSNGNTIIKGGKVLLAKSGTALVSYKGITIDDGTVYISDSAYGSISAYQGDIAINGGSVTVDYSGQAINTVLGDVNITDGTVTVKRAQESGISSTQGDVNISSGTVTVEQAQKLGINVFTGSSDAYKGTIRITGGKVTVDAVENALQAFSGGIVFGGNAVVEAHSEKSITAGSGDITVTGNDCDITLRTNAQSAIGGWIKLENADKIVALGGNSEKEAAEIKREEKDGKMQLHPTGCKYLHIAKGLIPAPTPTQTPVKTPTPTDTPAVTPTPTKMPVTPVETPNPTVEPTQTPTNTPAVTPAPTNTPAKTPEPTKTPVETPTPTHTPVTPAESPKPTAAPTAVPTTAPTAAPTSAPTATPEPTAEPTATASPVPTATPAPTQAPTSGGNSNSNKTNGSTNNTTTACPAPAQSTPAPAVQNAKVPQTSDVFPYTALVVLALASAAGLTLLFLRKKKQ